MTRIGSRLAGRAPRGVGALVRARRRRPDGQCALARAGLGDLRRGVRRRRGVRVVGAQRHARATCCWCWPRALGSRPISARRWARSASCAASGSTARYAWRGSKITSHRWREHADAPVPDRLQQGIRFENLSFAYPGTDRLVLDQVNLHFEPGSVVAIVGENGAGKSTLVKLLCRLYQPTSGRILVDGVELRGCRRIVAIAGLGRVSGLLSVRVQSAHTVGVGDLPRIDDRPAVTAAVDRAGASDVVEHLVAGLETQLGPTWPEGVELSFGQWQKLALARGFMRERPLLLVLDEPTAALDAETEHALFERYPRRRGAVEQRRPSTAASPSSSRTGLAPCAWPTSSWYSTAREWSSRARTTRLWPKVGSMPSSTRSRQRRIVRDDRVTRRCYH